MAPSGRRICAASASCLIPLLPVPLQPPTGRIPLRRRVLGEDGPRAVRVCRPHVVVLGFASLERGFQILLHRDASQSHAPQQSHLKNAPIRGVQKRQADRQILRRLSQVAQGCSPCDFRSPSCSAGIGKARAVKTAQLPPGSSIPKRLPICRKSSKTPRLSGMPFRRLSCNRRYSRSPGR